MPNRLMAGEPIEFSPSDFFTDLCPKILQAQKGPCAQLGGAYGIQLFGDKGGSWTLDFTTAAVAAGIADKVDLYLEMDSSDFVSLMKGTLDVEAAAKAGKISFNGDVRLFNNLAVVLQPAEA
jgi:hypothetical protein